MRTAEDFFVSVIGWINLNYLYEEWQEDPPCSEYAEPLEGWDLKFGQVFENGLSMLLFENIPEDTPEDTTFYRVLIYKGQISSFRLVSKIRFREQNGFRVDAISFDENLNWMYLRRSRESQLASISVRAIDTSLPEPDDAETMLDNCLVPSDRAFLFRSVSEVWFLRLPEDSRIRIDGGDPRAVLCCTDSGSGFEIEKDAEKEEEKDLGNTSASKLSVPGTALEELHDLIGLRELKEKVDEIVKYTAFRRKMQKLGRNMGGTVNLNFAFLGNPGTAKTTAARLFARVMKEQGILEKGELIEVGRADLIAKYTGQTAIKVQEVFQRAEGNVLFIDEAYSLLDSWENEFGDEAIATIVQEMENRRDRLIVIFAGYPEKMETFLSRNPGLRSRIPTVIRFENYSEDELVQIAESEASRRGYALAAGVRERIREICADAMKCEDFGNGRFCRNLLDAAELHYAARTADLDTFPLDDEGRLLLEAEDFTAAESQHAEKPLIGFSAA